MGTYSPMVVEPYPKGRRVKAIRHLSTIEAEYIVASEADKEAIWLHQLSANFSAKSQNVAPTPTLYCDTKSTIHLIRNPFYRAKPKHIEVRYHHIWDLVTKKRPNVQKTNTKVNITDSVNPLQKQCFGALREHMRIQQVIKQQRAE